MKFSLYQVNEAGKFFGAKIPKGAWIGVVIYENGQIAPAYTYGSEFVYPEDEISVTINLYHTIDMVWKTFNIPESESEFITDKVASTTAEKLLFPHFAGGFSPEERENQIHMYFDHHK